MDPPHDNEEEEQVVSSRMGLNHGSILAKKIWWPKFGFQISLTYVFEHLSEPYVGQHIDEIAFVPNKNSLLSTQGLFMETEKEITNRAPPTINNKKKTVEKFAPPSG